VVWLAVAVFQKIQHPFKSFILIGLAYGAGLALTHQVLWDASFGSNLPHLGGNLAGKLDPAVEQVLLRTAAFMSSIMTGLVTGALFGVVALAAKKVMASRS
ncbi:MAG TPA: hypothetical protein VMR98_06215, partial [Candidatus Polarisedimenticolaceae bacterium]|nr:hypothetical protein [Candidatus Polarisedimenticolaceae bacterium]